MQSLADILPPDVLAFVRGRVAGEFATVSAAGIAIDTPTYIFPSADLTSVDVGTGLAYPAKAERARRNPQVGMLIEGNGDDPVVSIAGFAAVHDANIQANVERYIAETIFAPNVNPDVVPWEQTRQRLYYLARVIVAVTPAHVRWWPTRRAMDEAAIEWRAPAGATFPASDPPPPGAPTKAPTWPQRSWQELADQALASGSPGHLTLLDEDGFPVPLRVDEIARSDEGFLCRVPRAAPWAAGTGTLSFLGKEVFVGAARPAGGVTRFVVERALPVLPMMQDRENLSREALAGLNGRLAEELKRRGLVLPVLPLQPPAPTEGALLRAAG
ncbi:MAG TPA: pyridoxamine 5'-phosphate oxidase family protein [Sphingobium sp.]|uniref:pyridoxamine 5'-phosphate oxidase family protein n=1 Tax=Sphingobium sp. TaxID=1912891 RepID=UPI002ECFE01D